MSKKVHLIRHGQSRWNVVFERNTIDEAPAQPTPEQARSLIDAELSDKGKEQCAALGQDVRKGKISPKLVVTSPLTRAIQTSLIAFEGTGIDIKVCHLHTEVLVDSCDLGSPVSALKNKFPHLDFGGVPEIFWYTEECAGDQHAEGVDEATKTYNHFIKSACREPPGSVAARLDKFKAWLRTLPHDEIAVVGHSDFIEAWTGKHLKNCEVLTVDL